MQVTESDRSNAFRRGVVVACLAAIALLLAPALGHAAKFTATSLYPVSISGEVTGEAGWYLTVDGTTVECEGTGYSGSSGEPSATLALDTSFSGCVAFGFVNATVESGGCDFVLDAGEQISSANEEFTGSIEIDCSAGGAITITAATCEVQIGDQVAFEDAEYVNGADDFEVEASASGIVANVTKDGFLCPLSGTGVRSSAMELSLLVSANDEGGGVPLFLAPAEVAPGDLSINEPNGAAAGNLIFTEEGKYTVVEQFLIDPFEGFKLEPTSKESCPLQVVVGGAAVKCKFEVTSLGAGTGTEATLDTKWAPDGGRVRVIKTKVTRP